MRIQSERQRIAKALRPMWCIMASWLVMLIGTSGCNSRIVHLSDGTAPIAVVLIGYDGEIRGTFGQPAASALSTLSERIAYARASLDEFDIRCDPRSGRALLATTDAEAWRIPPPSDVPRTIVWRDWLSPEDPIEFSRVPRDFLSESFIELLEVNPNGGSRGVVVDLSNPSNEYIVPEDFKDYDLLADGRWVATTNSELLSGKLSEGKFQIERRMPLVSASMLYASVTWLPTSKYVLIRSNQPRHLRGGPDSRKDTVLLDWSDWRLLDQPEEMRLASRGAFMLGEQPVFLAKAGGPYSRWRYAVVSDEGQLEWSGWRVALPYLYDPMYLSPHGGLILSRQNSRLLLYPGASPRLRVSTLSPEHRRRDLLKMSWTSIGGWLVAPVEESQ